MATFAKDTHETASIAALVGGTTTFIEMCCPSRLTMRSKATSLWKSKAEGAQRLRLLLPHGRDQV